MNVKLVKSNGTVKIDIDGELIEPLSFKSFRPTDKNISDFAQAGVRLFSILTSGLNSILGVPYSLHGESWVGNGQYDFSVVDKQIELFIKNAPNAYFALMVQLDTRPWYLEQHQGCPNSFHCLSQVAGNKEWRNAAADYLKKMIEYVEQRFPDRFYGYFMLGGTTTEWFSNRDYAKPHPYKEESYQQFRNDSQIVIPDWEKIVQCSKGTFKDPLLDGGGIDYWKFHHEIIADTILFFAAKAQEVLQHKKLLGVYFGYLFELSGERLWNDGHLEYEKVFLSPDIDMISSPSSYAHRKHSDAGAFMVTYDTLALHNKLYYLEFDHITHLAPQFIEGHGIPGYESKFENEQQTIDVMRRDFMLCVTKGAALWWFDMFEGWFYSQGMMDEVTHMISLSERLSSIPMQSVSEIAVFAEGDSLYYVDKDAGLNTDLLGFQRDGLARMGAPYDLFTISDIDHPDFNHDQYKLYIFLDLFKLEPKTRKVIEQKIKRQGKTILWIYAADYVQDGCVSAQCMSDFIGMQVKSFCSSNSLVEVDYGRGNAVIDKYQYTDSPETLFCVDDSNAVVWGRYQSSGYTALAYRKFEQYTSFYSAVGNIPANVLRQIGSFAGVHIYSHTNDPVYINSRLVGLYSDTDGEVAINLKEDMEVEELFSGSVYQTDNQQLRVPAKKGNAKLFLIK